MSSMFDFSPGVVAFLLAAAVLYVRAVLILRRRGWRVPRLQQLWWWIGLGLQAIALLGPPDAEADQVPTHSCRGAVRWASWPAAEAWLVRPSTSASTVPTVSVALRT